MYKLSVYFSEITLTRFNVDSETQYSQINTFHLCSLYPLESPFVIVAYGHLAPNVQCSSVLLTTTCARVHLPDALWRTIYKPHFTEVYVEEQK